MKKSIFIILAVLAISSCSGVKPTHHQNGRQVYEARCNSYLNNMSDCYKLASEKCRGRFEIVSQNEEWIVAAKNIMFYCY